MSEKYDLIIYYAKQLIKENPKLKIFEILKYFSNGRKLYKKGCKE